MDRQNQLVEILRIRHFLEHNSKQITKIKSEYTIRCNTIHENQDGVDNIFLTFSDFLPNLKITDSEGIEYPIMPNADVKLLLEIQKEEDNIGNIIKNIENKKTFLIWIKIPPNRKLKPNETRLISIDYEMNKVKKNNIIFLDVSTTLSFPVFWIFEKPENYNIKNPYVYKASNNKLESKKSWAKEDSLYYNDTNSSSILYVKPNSKNLIISYSFTPKPAIIVFPIASIVLLTSFSILLSVGQYLDMNNHEFLFSFEELLEHKIELTIFIISSSLLIPQFISNVEIRHRYIWIYLIPISIIIISFLWANINLDNVAMNYYG